MRDTTRTDLFLAALLSCFLHYTVGSVLPKAKALPASPRVATVELELAAPRTAEERAAPAPAISLPAPYAPEPEAAAATPIAVPAPQAVAPEATAAPEQAQREHPQDLPDDFLQAVDLPNANPDEPTPEDPHFLAQNNMNVQEETVARTRSNTGEAAEPEPSGRSPGESEEAGDAAQDLVAQEEDRSGEHSEAVASVAGTNQPPPIASQAENGGRESQEEVAAQEATTELGVGDATGEMAVQTEQGGEARAAQEGALGRAGRPGQGVDLRISWSQFRQIYGDGELERQRQEIAEQRRSTTRGHYRRNWERVRASLENYVPHVRAGNQTALRAAQSPFAAYLAHVHQKIHRYWADGFLLDLMALGDQHPLNDPNLRTDLEIVIAPDGQVAEVGVVRTSGQLAFDAAAIDSAYRSGPHPSPPDAIKSGDGRVYFHWGFYRNARQCGTFNATPFILPDPPNLPRDSATQPRPGGAQPPRTAPEPDRGEPAAPPPRREVADDAAAG